ncbi:hypothetical protein F5Y01DRAFT_317388 [Xylaria sp. FL0043]|nr:hypothetical protein F5Y01DRAFT_317388 [Xylaria sp. FL0043]
MGITEIIWDDALLISNLKEHTEPDLDFGSDDDLHDGASADRKDEDVDTVAHMDRSEQVHWRLPIEPSWYYYRILLQHQENVISTGTDIEALSLNLRILEEPCDGYNDLATIIQQPGFTRLQLDLLVGGQEHLGWSSFRSGLIRRALSAANDLEDARFRKDVVQDPDSSSQQHAGGSMEHFIPLLSIFPTHKWPRLRNFHFSGFFVQQTDVVSLLASLYPSPSDRSNLASSYS